MLNEQEQIHRYLKNEMQEIERQNFEFTIRENPELAQKIELNRDLIQFFQERNPALEQSLTDLSKETFVESKPSLDTNTNFFNRFRGLIIGFILFLIIGSIAFYNYNKESIHLEDYSTNHSVIDAEAAFEKGMNHEGGEEGKVIQNFIEEESQTEEQQTIEIEEKDEIKSNVKGENIEPIASLDDKKLYAPNRILEDLIQEDIRSNNQQFKVLFPKNNYTFHAKNGVTDFKINATTEANETFEIILYDNQEVSFTEERPILSTFKTTQSTELRYNLNIELKSGLYYFLIKNKTTTIYISKFKVEN